MLNTLMKQSAKVIVGVVVGFALFITAMGSFYIVGGTEYAVERTPNGKMIGVVDPGVHFKVPFLSSVHTYDQFYTVAYQDDDDNPSTFGTLKRINFADTYGGYIGSTIRFQILPDPVKLVEMHKAYLNADNLIQAGLKPVSKQLLTYTANQMTGETFMQGGQNEYQNRVEDQGINGLYVTKREKTLVKKSASNVGLGNENPTKREQRDSFIYINKIQKDKSGKALRNELPISKYGIKVVQVTIDDFQPESKLNDFINRKKNQIAIRQKLVEEQENERQSAVTAELKGQRERVEAKQKMLREKDAAVIKADKEVQLARKQAERETVERQKLADLAVIDKKKELQMATDNEGIQKANERAAKYEAEAIKHKGLAEAEVKKAMYEAVRKDILELEVQRVVSSKLAENLKDFKVEMPTYMSGTNGAGTNNSLDVLMDALSVSELKKLNTKMGTK